VRDRVAARGPGSGAIYGDTSGWHDGNTGLAGLARRQHWACHPGRQDWRGLWPRADVDLRPVLGRL